MAENKKPEPTDGDLARRVQAGDSYAFELLVRRYYRSVLALAAAHLSESADAEDAAQDAFLRALDRIQMFDPRRPFAPWLYQLARNVARNVRRKAWRQQTAALSSIEGTAESTVSGPVENLERSELHRLIDAAIHRLPERQRTAFSLFDVEGFSAGEVGEMMGLGAATVRSNVYHARRALRSQLAGQLQEGSLE